MAADKPVILIVHGAWHPPSYYSKLINPLRSLGYVVLAPPLQTTGLDDSVAGKTHLDDVRRIHEVLLPYLDAGREVVVVCHSQGGIAGSACVEDLTVAERRLKGLKGGVKAVVYIAAFAFPEKGMSLISAIGGKPADFYAADGPLYVLNEKAKMAFYNMLPETEQQIAYTGLVHQSLASQNLPAEFVAADVSVPKTYIVCTEDNAVPAAAQRAWAQAAGCRAVEVESDHSPFLRDESAEQVVHIIAEAARA